MNYANLSVSYFIFFGFYQTQAATLFIDNPQTLIQLESQGFDIARLVFNEPTTRAHVISVFGHLDSRNPDTI